MSVQVFPTHRSRNPRYIRTRYIRNSNGLVRLHKRTGLNALLKILHTPCYLIRGLSVFIISAVVASPHLAYAQSGGSEAQTTELTATLNTAVSRHPQVLSSAARVCQALHELGLTTASSRTQLSASIDGRSRLFSRFKSSNNSERGRAESRAFDVNDRQNIFDLDLNLEHILYDWGHSDQLIKSDELFYRSLQIRYHSERSFQLADILNLASQISESRTLISIYQTLAQDITPVIETLEARANAGFIRLESVRQAKIIELDNRLRIRQAENDLAQHTTNLQRRYGLGQQQGQALAALFARLRPQQLVEFDRTLNPEIQSHDLEIRGAEARETAFGVENKPRLTAELTGTMFDLADFEQEFEILGGVAFSMPLLDGGASKARQAQTRWQISELRSERQRVLDEITAQTTAFEKELADRQRILTVVSDKLTSQQEREASLRALSDRTDVSPLELLRLLIDISESQSQSAIQIASIDRIFVRSLHHADQLTTLLNISGGQVTC